MGNSLFKMNTHFAILIEFVFQRNKSPVGMEKQIFFYCFLIFSSVTTANVHNLFGLFNIHCDSFSAGEI